MNKIIIICFLLICGCTVPNSQESTGQYEEIPDPQTKLTINDLQLVDLEGNTVPASNFQGQAVFVNLWATWCRPCLEEMPDIENAQQKLQEKEVEMHFIFPSNESIAKIQKFKKGNDYDFRYFHLANNFEQLGIYTLPTTLLFNKDGKLVETFVGAREWDLDDAIDYLESIAD
ncbi:MAG: TlpA family protein disulfide reductase [Candidatus Cyclobacteriaceae bacterium M2_1C_046]